jgi:hypothetical protein
MKKILMFLAIAGAVYVSASDVFTKVDLHPSVVWLKNADGSSVLTTATGQPLEDQRVSTTDSPSFVKVTSLSNEQVFAWTQDGTNYTKTLWFDTTNQVERITLVEEAAE